MRAIYIFLIFINLLILGCASVEVAKEVTKASKKIETSVKTIFKSPEEEKEEKEEKKETEISEKKKEVSKEQKEIEISEEKKEVSVVVAKQKEIVPINLLGKNLKELDEIFGKSNLIRKNDKTISARFDSEECRLFVFMNSTLQTPRVEYYEIRNVLGELVDRQKDIEQCFKKIKKI